MASRILVPLDGSPLSETALPWAKEMALRTHARIYLFQAVPSLTFVQTMAWLEPAATAIAAVDQQREQSLQNTRRYLRDAAERNLRGIEAATMAGMGEAAAAIVEAAVEVGAGLIVMATHGRSGFARMVLGSVAEGVARTSPVPVLLVPPGARRAVPQAAAPAATPLPPA